MCGRFSFVVSQERVKRELGWTAKGLLRKSYNIAPSQTAVVRTSESAQLQDFRWGLIPNWARNIRVGNNLINARMEGIAGKVSFRMPIRRRRCLVLADSFYEWKKMGQQRHPYRILFKEPQIMTFAGVWDEWEGSDGDIYRSFAIITTPPNAEMRALHDRMPAFLQSPEQREKWLQEDLPLPEVLALLGPLPDGQLSFYPVSPKLNSPDNDYPELHKEEPPAQSALFD